ncbi:ubiquitin carrier [Fusarium beomiforme]|uniref:Ubiquitin carrier n=1 Tax=Fusarium beomiforme TaxID=44412 RepID=A0A9P5A4J8_9HYPO|nr:ubiquitin carrier [Fusarium beomiforme]
MKFITKIWHPNVDPETGEIGSGVFGSWDPTDTIRITLESIAKLLEQPNLQWPKNAEAAKIFKEDQAGFAKKAQQWAVQFAGAPSIENDQARYGGYNPNLVQQFVDMGFGVEAVVKAFEFVGVDRNNGQDYTLEEAYQGDVLARLSEDW